MSYQSKFSITVAAYNTHNDLRSNADFVVNSYNDDAAATINQAIDSAKDSGGNYCPIPILLLPGDYFIDSPVTVFDSLNLSGHNKTETKIFLRGDTDGFNSNGHTLYANLNNFTIEGQSANSGNGIYGDFSESRFENLRMRNIKQSGIRIESSTGGCLLNIINLCDISCTGDDSEAIAFDSSAYDSWVMNCNIGSKFRNLRLEGGPFRILNNHLNGTTANTYDDKPVNNIYTEEGINSTIISQNIIENAREDAIVLQRTDNSDSAFTYNNVSITGNVIRSESLENDMESYMIKIQRSPGKVQPFRNVTIANNIFEQRIKDNQQNGYAGVIYLENAKDIMITGNIKGTDSSQCEFLVKKSGVAGVLTSDNSNT